MKKICMISFLFLFMMTCIPTLANELSENYDENKVIEIKENGDVDISSVDQEVNRLVIQRRRSSVNVGVVNFGKTTGVINYVEEATGRTGYINANSAADGAYLGTNSQGMVRFKQAGVVGLVDASLVQIVDYNDVSSVNFYRVEDGYIKHYITTNVASNAYQYPVVVGPKQSYMSDDKVYYSYDGHYFYTSFSTMIDDYKNNTYKKSINANKPYYNYFQYLSHRTKSNFTANQLNKRISDVVGSSSSVMLNQGSAFIQYQNTFGANALLMFGVAANESGWGRSNIALSKNNLFGHNAYDSNPEAGANGYKNAAQSIWTHAKVYVSTGYANPNDWRYNGSQLGEKLTGMNVKYASDPYWGEKAASQGYYIEMDFGNKNIDYGKYTIGVKTTYASKGIYAQPTSTSTKFYETGQILDYPFTIIGTVQGESISGNNLWYKIQSDVSLNDARTKSNTADGNYNWQYSYAYVHSSNIQIVSKGSNLYVSKITMNPTSATISVGKTFKAQAHVTPTNAVDSRITWKSGNTKILTVDQNGTVKAVGVGRTYVYAISESGVEAKSLITVVQTPKSIAINPSSFTIGVGNSYTPKVILSPSNSATSLTWKSGNTKILTVDSSGKITAKGAGKTYVYVTTSNGLTAKTLVTVVKVPANVIINPSHATMSIGKQFQAKAIIQPSDTPYQSVAWKSSDSNVASVDTSGVVIAKSAGTVIISATTSNGKVATTTVKVLPMVQKLTVNPTSAFIKVGKSFQATPYYSPTNAINKSVTWSSSNEAVVTVNQNGKITAVGEGEAIITLTTSNKIKTSLNIRVIK